MEYESEPLETQWCFRCKNMAVMDMGHIRLLPMVMDRARVLLLKAKFNTPEDEEEAWHTQDSLSIYRSILDSIPVD